MLDDFGWELVEVRSVARLWVDEIWLIRSAWSPTDCEVYLTFEIDPLFDSRDTSKVWAARASLSRPDDWFAEKGSVDDRTVDDKGFGGNFSIEKEAHLELLFDALGKLRDSFELHVH